MKDSVASCGIDPFDLCAVSAFEQELIMQTASILWT
jgi:hypothetical protein